MSDILAKIEAYKREEIAAAKRAKPLAALETAAKAAAPPRGFLNAIEQKIASGNYALIAEIKKASPPRKVLSAPISTHRSWRRPMKPAARPASRS